MSVQQPLHSNAKNVDDLTTRLVSFLQENGKKLLIGACLIGTVAVLVNYFRSSAEHKRAVEWSKYAEAQGAAGLGDFATDHPESIAGVWARLAEAEQSFREGVRMQFSDRKGAESELKRAADAFAKVLKLPNVPSVATERALIGQARLLEATSDGNLDEAKNAYSAFVQKYPDSIYKDSVQERLDSLNKSGTKDFYAWFAKQNPKPEDRKRPQDGLPPGHPDFPVTLPPIPDELYPANWSELKSDLDLETKPAEKGPAEATDAKKDEPASKADASAKKADSPAPAEKAPEPSKPDVAK